MTSGITNPWQELTLLDPQQVCRQTKVDFDATTGCYLVPSLGQIFYVNPKTHVIVASSPSANIVLPRIQFHAQMAFPYYLVHAQDRAPTGQFMNPRALKGGDFFARGTHQLPLDKVAAKFGSDAKTFLAQGKMLGGKNKEYGDAAWLVLPLPRVPVLIILWRGDEEFPPRAELLFDQAPTTYLPIDILWAMAMMCVNVIL